MGPEAGVGGGEHLADGVAAAIPRGHPLEPLLQLQFHLRIPVRCAHPAHRAARLHQVNQAAVGHVRHQQPRHGCNHVLELKSGGERLARFREQPQPALLALPVGDVVRETQDTGDGTVSRVERSLGGLEHHLLARLEAKDFLHPERLSGGHHFQVVRAHHR